MEEPEQTFKVKVEFTEDEYTLLGNRLADLSFEDGVAQFIHDIVMRSLNRKARKAKRESGHET